MQLMIKRELLIDKEKFALNVVMAFLWQNIWIDIIVEDAILH